MDRPAKRARLLDGDDSDDAGGVPVVLKINDEYAKRHQHNAARAEKHRLEEKYKNGLDDESGSDSDSESEDDVGELATKELDDQIQATLQAIKTKDPRVYNKEVKFYTDEELQQQADIKAKSKPILLRDYHRQNLLAGDNGSEEEPAVLTYEQEQSALKQDLLKEARKAQDGDADGGSDADGDDFLVAKAPKERKAVSKQPELDVTMADKDPETYLSNFMTSRAWAANSGSQFAPFESDDDSELDRADDFEAQYNLRFEDSSKLNENLTSHSRQAAEKYSVRREEPKGRKKARQDAKTRREEEKKEKESDKARLRRLRIEEAHEKWLRLKEAAGLKHQHLPDDKLVEFLERGFEDENWDQEMAKVLGNDYYEQVEDGSEDSEAEDGGKKKKRKLKKPVWNDDIDIGDIDPDFMTREASQSKIFTLSDDEKDAAEASTAAGSNQNKKEAEKSKSELKRKARLERRKIEELVDSRLEDSLPVTKHTGFRYRETSPTALGLSAREILMAEDAQLNQFAGLKKLAAFRDESKKARERKKLGKKARLRQWRKDTFGTEEQAKDEDFEAWFNRNRGLHSRDQTSAGKAAATGATATGDGEAKKKKKHSRKQGKKRKADEVE